MKDSQLPKAIKFLNRFFAWKEKNGRIVCQPKQARRMVAMKCEVQMVRYVYRSNDFHMVT